MAKIEEKYITFRRDPFFQLAKDQIFPGSKVLDVGAGFGSFADFCKLPEIYLFEGNIDSVNLLKERYVNVNQGVLPKLPYDSSFFDLIHCSHVMEHLEPSEFYESLKEFDRVLKPGGKLVVSTPLLWSGFYDDLSHVKPYSSNIFDKYLCENVVLNTTRPKISDSYVIDKLVFRYLENYDRFNFHYRRFKFLGKSLVFLFFILKKLGFLILEKTGYTIILSKRK